MSSISMTTAKKPTRVAESRLEVTFFPGTALPIAAEIQYLAKKKSPSSLETVLSKSQALQRIVTSLAELVGPTDFC